MGLVSRHQPPQFLEPVLDGDELEQRYEFSGTPYRESLAQSSTTAKVSADSLDLARG